MWILKNGHFRSCTFCHFFVERSHDGLLSQIHVICLSKPGYISSHSTTYSNILVEETKNLASNVLSAGLLVVHDTGRGGQDDETELTRGQQLDNPLLHVAELNVVAGRDDTGLVDTADELDDNLAVAVVVDLLELANVA
jgi:hypothetical protein